MAHLKHHALTALQLHFLGFLLEGKREISETEAAARRDHLELDKLQLPCVVVCVSPYYTKVEPIHKDRIIQDYCEYIWNWLEKKDLDCYCITNAYDNTQVIISMASGHMGAGELDELFISLRQKLQARFGLELFIGIGSVVDRLTGIARSAAETMEMLAYKHQYADRGVVNIVNTVRFQHYANYSSDIMFERVIGCFQDGDLGKMAVRLSELIESIRNRPYVSDTSIRRTIVELTVNILHVASNANVDADEILHGVEPYTWILQQDNTEVLTEWLLDLSTQLLSRMEQRHETEEKEVIHQACDYIEMHLQDRDLSLQAVSEKVGLSVSYFSQLFKTEKRIGMSNYVTERRIQRAQDMLMNSGLKTEDIALQLGFSTVSYFGQVFKKTTGMTPNAYRKHVRTAQR